LGWSTAASTANNGAGRRNPIDGEGALRLSSYCQDELMPATLHDLRRAKKIALPPLLCGAPHQTINVQDEPKYTRCVSGRG